MIASRAQLDHTLRGARFVLLRALAAVCEPLTRAGWVSAEKQVGILTFHRVAPEARGAAPLTWNVPPDVFRHQLVGLLRLGFEPWSLRNLLGALADHRELPSRAFVVTFDDGYANVHDYAWPILRELRIPATLFLATGYIGGDAPFPFDDWSDKGRSDVPVDRWRPLSFAQIKAMSADPLIEFGSHTHFHKDYRGDPAAFARDLEQSIALLRTECGVDAPTFAFPFGASDSAMIDVARRSGLRCALGGRFMLVRQGADPFQLGRFNVDEFETSKTLSLKLDGWYERLKRRPRQLEAHS